MIVSRKISVQAVTALLAAFAAVVLLAAMPSTAAALNWSTPATDLSDGPNDASNQQLAVAVDGATTVVWSRWDGSNYIVQAKTRAAGSSTFGAAVNLSSPGQDADYPQVAVGADGATTVVWYRFDGSRNIVQARTRPAGSDTFGAAANLSAAGENAYYPQVAVGANGATTVVWVNWSNDKIVRASTRPAGSGTFGAAVDLSATGRNADFPQVAVAADGTTTVVWERWNGSDYIVQARTRAAGSSTFSAVVDLSAAGRSAYNPQLAVAVDGATTVVWSRWDGSNYIVQAKTRAAGSSTFGAAVNLSSPGQDADYPQVAVGADGATTVVWARDNGGYSIIQASTRPAGSSTFAAAVDSSGAGYGAAGYSAGGPQVVIGADGATTVVWTRWMTSSVGNFTIQASTRPAGSSTFGVAVDLSGVLGTRSPSPQVAVGAGGTATVVWTTRSVGSPNYSQIQGSTSGATMYSLTLTRSGAGSGSVSSSPDGIDCGLVCSYSFRPSTSVMLIASPAAGSSFAGWNDSECWGTLFPICTVTMSAARSVTAEFAVAPPEHFDLALSKSGTGSGTVTSSPAGIDCGSDCLESLENGSSVTLTAKPKPGSSFAGWNDSECWDTSPCEVRMSEARRVDAKFTKSKLPSNSFTIRSVKVGVKALTSTVVLPGRGKLTQRVTRKRTAKAGGVLTLCKTSKKVTKAGTVKLTCKISSATRKARAKQSLKISVKTTFTPTGGLKASKTKTIKLKRRR